MSGSKVERLQKRFFEFGNTMLTRTNGEFEKETKKTERELQEMNERVRLIIKGPDGMFRGWQGIRY